MTPKEKAIELVKKFTEHTRIFDSQFGWHDNIESAKQCALIAVEKEYNSLREQLCNLRSCHVIENEKVYLARIDLLNQEESQIKTELEHL
jgi:hypothetical protein